MSDIPAPGEWGNTQPLHSEELQNEAQQERTAVHVYYFMGSQ